MPLLSQRILVLTLSLVNSDEICLNAIPRPLKADEKNENNALTTPLSLTGTPAELLRAAPNRWLGYMVSQGTRLRKISEDQNST